MSIAALLFILALLVLSIFYDLLQDPMPIDFYQGCYRSLLAEVDKKKKV
jgi:hypothetical protein